MGSDELIKIAAINETTADIEPAVIIEQDKNFVNDVGFSQTDENQVLSKTRRIAVEFLLQGEGFGFNIWEHKEISYFKWLI